MDREQGRLVVHTLSRKRGGRKKRMEKKRERTFGERLLRNTAISCALLIGAMALSRVDAPWSRDALDAARSAMTMRVDVAGALSKVAFVRELFPETALVFWNLGMDDLYLKPVSGEVVHAWSEMEPYMEFSCRPGDVIYASASGTVENVARGAGGQYLVSVAHSDGSSTRYAYLAETELRAGDPVLSGDALGTAAGDYVYFELRVGGERADPGDLRIAAGE